MAETQEEITDPAKESMSEEDVLDENRLISFLEGLTPGDFASIVTRIPGASARVPDGVPHLERVAGLIRFVRAANGIQLEGLKKIVDDLFPHWTAGGNPQRATSSTSPAAILRWWPVAAIVVAVLVLSPLFPIGGETVTPSPSPIPALSQDKKEHINGYINIWLEDLAGLGRDVKALEDLILDLRRPKPGWPSDSSGLREHAVYTTGGFLNYSGKIGDKYPFTEGLSVKLDALHDKLTAIGNQARDIGNTFSQCIPSDENRGFSRVPPEISSQLSTLKSDMRAAETYAKEIQKELHPDA